MYGFPCEMDFSPLVSESRPRHRQVARKSISHGKPYKMHISYSTENNATCIFSHANTNVTTFLVKYCGMGLYQNWSYVALPQLRETGCGGLFIYRYTCTVLLQYFTGIIFYQIVILEILRVFNFRILSVLDFVFVFEYQTKHLLNMAHNVIIEALKHVIRS